MFLQPHFAEDTFALKLFLQSPKGLIDIVVANTNLHLVLSIYLRVNLVFLVGYLLSK